MKAEKFRKSYLLSDYPALAQQVHTASYNPRDYDFDEIDAAAERKRELTMRTKALQKPKSFKPEDYDFGEIEAMSRKNYSLRPTSEQSRVVKP